MTDSLSRRTTLIMSVGATLPSLARTEGVSTSWMLGAWQSDRDRTVRGWRLPPHWPELDARNKERFSLMFGRLRYIITPRYFTVCDMGAPIGAQPARLPYAVLSATESSISLHFTRYRLPTVTLFRESEDVLFTRSSVRNNLEFFNRVVDEASNV